MKRGGLQRRAAVAAPGSRAAVATPSAFADLLWLQRVAGNQAVYSAIQRKAGEATDDVLTHIFAGEVKTDSKGRVEKVVGYHSEAEKGTAVVEVPDKGRTEVTGYAGIYHAEPVRDKATKAEKSGGSTFYPRNWDRSAVTLAIEKSQTLTGDATANRKVSGNGLPGLDGTVEVLLKVAGETIYPVRTKKRPKRVKKKTT